MSQADVDHIDLWQQSEGKGIVIDLDNTLLHGTFSLPKLEEMQNPLVEVFRVEYYCSELATNTIMWVALRPYCRRFLEMLHAKTQVKLAVYTNGIASYACKILEILDPDGKFFGHGATQRLIFRKKEDHMNKLASIFRERFGFHWRQSLIIDDRPDVWESEKDNFYNQHVLRVKPFKWFQDGFKTSAAFKELSPDVELDFDFADMRQTQWQKTPHLQRTLSIICKVIEGSSSDLSDHVSICRGKVFQGCHFVFSGLPQSLSQLLKECEDFGAVCYIDFNEELLGSITHLVSGNHRLGINQTNKEKLVRKWNRGHSSKLIETVSVEWLLDSICLWRQMEIGEEYIRVLDPHRISPTNQSSKAYN